MSKFENLLAPLRIGKVELRNRMVFTAHDTLLQERGLIGAAYVAYQAARARGGAGLQIVSAANVTPEAGTIERQIRLDIDEAVAGYRAVAEAVHAEGGTIFAQLLHAGREVYSAGDGTIPLTFAPSAVRSERSHVMPRALDLDNIRRIVAGYGSAARRAVEAGMDGVEICANQGNLPAQFLAESTNRRDDDYGGTPEKRARFLLEICEEIRKSIGADVPIGLRLSLADLDDLGLTEEEGLYAFQRVADLGLVDYLHVVLGTGASRAGAYHIVPPMTSATGYIEPYAAKVRSKVSIPLIVTGRFNTAHAAEDAIARGSADAVGMTRAMICDPEMPGKVARGRVDDVRACIACNQACIGHFQKGCPVSCIQFPESGRETTLGRYLPAAAARKIMVVGGGPAGMKAASVAAGRGHHVLLCEASRALGGQALTAALLPTRAEFGGIVTNLAREVELAGVEVRLGARVGRAIIDAERPDAIILATGAQPERHYPNCEDIHVVEAVDLVTGDASAGKNVLVADAMCDWTGLNIAAKLAADGHRVILAVNGLVPGETLPAFVRDEGYGRLSRLGVEIIPMMRLFGATGDTVYLQNLASLEARIIDGIDTLVVHNGMIANTTLEEQLAGMDIPIHPIGDCLTPRTAEEAVLDGLKIAREV